MRAENRNAVAIPVLVSLIVGASFAAWASYRLLHVHSHQQQVPSAADLALLLYRAGLDPESLAAAGVTAERVPALISHVRDNADEWVASLSAADQSFQTGSDARAQLSSMLTSGQGTPENRTALASAEAELQRATQARNTTLQDVFMAATRDLPSGGRAMLLTLASCRFDYPVHFRAVERADPASLTLRDALAVQRISQANGDSIPENAAQVIRAEESNSAVATARINVNANGTAVQLAWTAALR